MHYVADTNALIPYILYKLPKGIDEIFRSTEKGESTMFIPTIALLECLYAINKGTVDFDFDDLLIKIYTYKNFVVIPLDIEIVEFMSGTNPEFVEFMSKRKKKRCMMRLLLPQQ